MPKINFNAVSYLPLPGTLQSKAPETTEGEVTADTPVEVTLVLRYEKSPGTFHPHFQVTTREEFTSQFHASDEDIELVKAFAGHFGLTVAKIAPDQRTVELKGTAGAFAKAFHVKLLSCKTKDGRSFRSRSGHIELPVPMLPVVEAVLGLDNRPVATPKYRIAKKKTKKKRGVIAHNAPAQTFYPNQLSGIYGFPKDLTGKNQCIAIIELDGGYRTEDIAAYFKQLDLPAPDITSVSVDGSDNKPTNANSADAEVMLDIEVAAGIAPDAKIAVYFAPNTDKGFFDAIHAAIYDKQNKPAILSISWGSSEDSWTDQSRTTYNNAFQTAAMLGITVCAAAGDSGSSDGINDGKVHVDFPASSPFVLGCGGTTLVTQNQKIVSETVWHGTDGGATGGGVSDYFAKPDYQEQISVPTSLNNGFAGRGVPDIAADADPDTGYEVLVDGETMVIGGTSAVAPLMAGLIARLNQLQGKSVGFIHHDLYNGKYQYRDITEGNNKTAQSNQGYAAAKGWDACTGWGVLYGVA